MSRIVKWIGLAILLGVALYIGVYIYASHSEAYRFAQQWLRQSEPLKAAVGEIQKTRVSPWGGYREYSTGSDRRVWIVVEVTGSKDTADVKLALRKHDETWRVVQSGVLE
jgi:hypothetical protein